MIEPLVWLGIGTAGGLAFAVFFYLIAVALNARDKKKEEVDERRAERKKDRKRKQD